MAYFTIWVINQHIYVGSPLPPQPSMIILMFMSFVRKKHLMSYKWHLLSSIIPFWHTTKPLLPVHMQHTGKVLLTHRTPSSCIYYISVFYMTHAPGEEAEATVERWQGSPLSLSIYLSLPLSLSAPQQHCGRLNRPQPRQCKQPCRYGPPQPDGEIIWSN